MKLIGLIILCVALMAGGSVFPASAQQRNQDASRLSALAAPILQSPADGTAFTAMAAVTLTWDLPAGTTQYHIQVYPFSNDGPGINLIRDAATTYTIDPPILGLGPYVILPGMTYTWRIRATDKTTSVDEGDASWGAWSTARTFTTPAASATTITPVQPPLGGTTPNLMPLLEWTDSNGFMFYYEIQVSKDIDFKTDPRTATAAVYMNLVHGGQADPPNSWSPPPAYPLEGGQRYYWRVRPRVQGNGKPTDWSTAFFFNTPSTSAQPTPTGTPSTTPIGTPTPKPEKPDVSKCSWDGPWTTTRGAMVISQERDFIFGPYAESSKINGSIVGSRIAGTWAEFESKNSTTPRITGKFVWERHPENCDYFLGTWGFGESSTDGGDWKGVRTKRSTTPTATKTPTADPSKTPTPPPTTVLNCRWDAPWTTNRGDGQWTQSGENVFGPYGVHSKISGVIRGDTLVGTWVAFDNGENAPRTGTGYFKISFKPTVGCEFFSGTWGKDNSDSNGGEWTGQRLDHGPSPSKTPTTTVTKTPEASKTPTTTSTKTPTVTTTVTVTSTATSTT